MHVATFVPKLRDSYKWFWNTICFCLITFFGQSMVIYQ